MGIYSKGKGHHLRKRWPGALLAAFVWLTGTIAAAWDSSAAAPQPPKAKATWLWDTSLIGTSFGRNQIFEFVSDERISRIFLQIDTDIDPSDYRSFIITAADYNVEIYALDGAPEWALPEHRQRIGDLIRWVNAYNSSVDPNERFAGIQLDVEPYLLPAWNTDQEATARHWLEAMAYFHDETKQSAALATSAALPFWLDAVTADGENSLAEAMIGKLDEVALMSYRSVGEEAVSLVQEELDLGDKYEKQVWIGLETNRIPDTPFISFYDAGKMELTREIARIDKLLKARSSYAGICVHDYSGWRSLR
ncbi:hypothetical protein PAESOLCIP111_04018 [Paenibacillus solanacearum]|uniref:Uncharacterized protein n=1 Tax=Paenibacillus solanacearum TaxID=2048548 RepID=A0A916K3J2_9BACL|nr:hypothetical protein [Paenibacillus solanacearum]CAG7639183.1 hypothetical protein PAESOLCIP111_04018 [Paenibacillus solanacearum]